MIHELRIYSFHPGMLPTYLHLSETLGRPVRGDDYGINLGVWTSEFGPLNQVWSLWQYDSFEERSMLRAALAKNPRWRDECVPQMRPLMARQDVSLLNPVKPLVGPAFEGGVYEVLVHRTQVGAARSWVTMFLELLPADAALDLASLGLWTGEVPQPNEVTILSSYPDMAARSEAKAERQTEPRWGAFLANTTGMVVATEAALLLPTKFSPMQ